MKKYLLPLLLLAAPAFAAQQEITAVPDSPVLPSIGALKDAVNLRLADIDENFDEIYTAVGTRPWVIQATAPADTTLAWFDTDQVVDAVVLKIHNGERWVPQAIGEGGSYTLPTAAADTLGGVKVGSRLTITDGVLSADVQTTDISGKENSLGNPSTSGYVLSSTTSGVRSWIEMTGGGTGIAHATSDGNYYASKDGGWASLAGVFLAPTGSADSLTITDTGTYFTTDTVAAALQELGSDLADVTEITLDASLTETGGVLSVTNPVTTEVYGSDWSADTEGTMRKDIYAILHAGDTDDDGKADLLDAAVVIPDSGTLTFDESAADPNDADVQLSAADGVFKFAAVNGANNEDLTIDLDGAANTATLSSSTGLTMITTGSIPFTSAVKTTAIDTDTTLSGALEYGVMTFNTAASTRTLTVTAGAGKSGCFRNAQGVAQILRIDAADGDYIVKPTGARTSAAGEYYGAAADAKNQICWVSYDDTDIYVTSEVGTWTEQE